MDAIQPSSVFPRLQTALQPWGGASGRDATPSSPGLPTASGPLAVGDFDAMVYRSQMQRTSLMLQLSLIHILKGAETESRLALLRVLGRIGSPQALEVVLASLNDADARVAGEALSVLTDWPAQDAAPHLLTLAQGADPDRKAAGMQGYVRLAEANPSVEERFAMLTKAMALAERPEDKKLVLGPWGSVRTLPSLEALRPYLDDPAIQNEAAVAIIAVARQVGQDANARPQALDALNAVAAKCQDANIRERAQQTLASFK